MAKKAAATSRRKRTGAYTDDSFANLNNWIHDSGYHADANDRPAAEVYVQELGRRRRGEDLEFPNALTDDEKAEA